MHVTVRLFARLRDIAGTARMERSVPAGATIGAVWSGLVADYPGLAPHGRTVSSARNADFARMHVEVAEGDEIAFLPPVSGG